VQGVAYAPVCRQTCGLLHAIASASSHACRSALPRTCCLSPLTFLVRRLIPSSFATRGSRRSTTKRAATPWSNRWARTGVRGMGPRGGGERRCRSRTCQRMRWCGGGPSHGLVCARARPAVCGWLEIGAAVARYGRARPARVPGSTGFGLPTLELIHAADVTMALQ